MRKNERKRKTQIKVRKTTDKRIWIKPVTHGYGTKQCGRYAHGHWKDAFYKK